MFRTIGGSYRGQPTEPGNYESSTLSSRNVNFHTNYNDNTPMQPTEYYLFQAVGRDFEIYNTGTGHVEFDRISLHKLEIPTTGIKACFDGDAYIKTDAFKKLNFDREDDFAISFWLVNPAISQSISSSIMNSIISKRGVQDTLKLNRKTNKRELVEENITQQIVKRISYRKAMKRAMQSALRIGA